jgi:hypothetical protein
MPKAKDRGGTMVENNLKPLWIKTAQEQTVKENPNNHEKLGRG